VDPQSQLDHVRGADDDSARCAQPRHGHGVARRELRQRRPAAGARAHPAHAEDLLHSDRDAVQRPSPPTGPELDRALAGIAQRGLNVQVRYRIKSDRQLGGRIRERLIRARMARRRREAHWFLCVD